MLNNMIFVKNDDNTLIENCSLLILNVHTHVIRGDEF